MNKVIYKGVIRDGKPGTFTKENYEVVYSDESKSAKLNPLPKIDYDSDAYRKLVNDSALAEDYFKEHDKQQPGYFKFIGPYLKRGYTVADCGCGGGSMLDLIKGVAGTTIAIEPFIGYHASLRDRKHLPYNSITNALNEHSGKVDLALSIHVIEHTEDPLSYLKEIYNLLKPGGVSVVFTPNLDDVLLKLYPEKYAPFFYRTVHNYYFTGESLEILGKQAGFKKADKFYYHEFGFANLVNWLKDGKGMGNVEINGIDSGIDANWKIWLEETGQSYNVGVVLYK